MESLARALAAHTQVVFSLMGNGNAWFLDAVSRAGMKVVSVRHEAATVAAADAYRRATGQLAVASTTYGPGFSNALTPLAEAALAGTPLLMIAGAPPRSGLRAFDVDQAPLARACGAQVLVFDETRSPETLVAEAVSLALRTPGPVVLELPSESPAQPQVTKQDATSLSVTELAAVLSESENLLILAGRGAIAAREHVCELAARLGAQVATTAPAKGFFQNITPALPAQVRDLGVCGGFATEEAFELIKSCDLVFAIGAGLNDFTTTAGTGFGSAQLIQLNERPTAHQGAAKVDTFIQARAEDFLPQLLAELPEAAHRTVHSDSLAVPLAPHSPGDVMCADGLLDPRRLFNELNSLLPASRCVVTDGGHFMAWPAMYLDVPAPDRLVLVGTAFRSIGLGFPSAIGVISAALEELTVLVTGDGGGLMGLADAESVVRLAAESGARLLIVVVNDAAYGAEIHQYAHLGVVTAPMEIPEVNFVELLRAFGATGAVINQIEDLAAITTWLNTPEAPATFVADARVSRSVVAPFLRVHKV